MYQTDLEPAVDEANPHALGGREEVDAAATDTVLGDAVAQERGQGLGHDKVAREKTQIACHRQRHVVVKAVRVRPVESRRAREAKAWTARIQQVHCVLTLVRT